MNECTQRSANIGMDTRQFIEWGKKYFDNRPRFICIASGNILTGEWLDAYFEFVRLDKLPDGFVTIKQMEEAFGRDLKFLSADEDCPWPISSEE